MSGSFAPLEVVCCDPPFSFFQEADRYESPQHIHPLHRGFSLARKLGARTLVRENISEQSWLLEEDRAISRALAAECTPSAWRLSFFRASFRRPDEIEAIPADSYMGYLVVVRMETTDDDRPLIVYVHDAVIQAPLLLNNYMHCSRKFRAQAGGRDFWIEGSYFCQQNGVTGLCAHAALRTVLTNLGPRGRNPVVDRDINDLLDLTPGRDDLGLSAAQIVRVLEGFGFKAVCHDFFHDPVVEYPEFVHPFLESGSPVLLSFTLEDPEDGHIVAVIGHTLNSDPWYPEARLGYPLVFPSRRYSYVPAAYWTDNLIVQDDNYGMYTCVSRRCLSKTTLPHHDPRSRCLYAFAVLRRHASRRPLNAEYNAIVLLTTGLRSLPEPIGPRWLEELRKAVVSSSRAPVFRTVLVTRREYVAHAATMRDWSGNCLSEAEITALRQNLPARFWMVEVTIPNLYTANKRKLGELLFDLRRPSRHDPLACWIGGRLPGIFYAPVSHRQGVPRPARCPLEGHVELYRGAKPSPRPPEW